jgi:hypothetical protein
MTYQVKEIAGSWAVLANGVAIMAGLTKEAAIAKGRELQKAAISYERDEAEGEQA